MKTKLNIVLFAYSFPHRKTIGVIQRLYSSGFSIDLILAANYIKINAPKSAFVFPKYKVEVSLEDLSRQYKIPTYVVEHNSKKTLFLLKKYNINCGIIGGARILSKSVISIIKHGILNFHPALLPSIRGLDSIFWTIYKGSPLGVTAHLINHKIDAGYLVVQKKIKLSFGDSMQSIYEKIYQLQLDLIPISLNLILKETKFKVLKMGKYNTRMSYPNQIKVQEILQEYINQHAI